MSQEVTTLPIRGLTEGEQDELNFLWRQLADRQKRNRLRTAYYESRKMLRQVGSVVPPTYYRLAMVLGWSGKAVDALSRRCTLEDLYWPDGDLDSLGYQEFRDDNHLRATIKAAGVKSLVHGVSWLVNTEGSGDEPDSLLHYKDALNATGRWNNRRRALDSFLSVNAWDGEQPTAVTLYLDGLTVTCERGGRKWVVDRQEHPWGVPAEPMMYHPWARTFGASRVTRPMMSLQDRAVASVIRMEAHMDIYAIPDLWLLGADMGLFKNADGTQKAAWQVMMGRIKAVPDDKEVDDAKLARADVKHIPASSPEPHLAAINGYAKLFAREADLPDSSLAITDVANPTSADSYIESRESLIAEAEGAMDDWSLPVRRSVARGLAIKNGLDEVPPELSSLTDRWRSPVYLSRAQAADAGAKILGAAPEWLRETDVGLELLGLSSDQIRRALGERRRVEGRVALAALTRAAESARAADER